MWRGIYRSLVLANRPPVNPEALFMDMDKSLCCRICRALLLDAAVFQEPKYLSQGYLKT